MEKLGVQRLSLSGFFVFVSRCFSDSLFLFSASAFSNVAQYELGKFFKRNTYIDIGTSLSHEFGIPAEREYLLKFKEGKLSELKSCTWN